jgi:hypothetical protein
VITLELAQRLRAEGVPWTPAPGDRFVLPGRGMDQEVFVIADMVVEAVSLPSGHVLRFNGTTEWALDSLQQDDVLWLPREDQLRDLLGDAFVALRRGVDGHEVVLGPGSGAATVAATDVECAYALAVLAHLAGMRA